MLNKISPKQDKFKKQQLGQVFTPKEIVDFMIRKVNPTMQHSIIEPSCGDGAFILGLLDLFLEQGNNIDDIKEWFEHKLVALDIDNDALEQCKNNITNWFSKYDTENINLSNIKCVDALTCGSFETVNNSYFDICIGNPPYIQVKHMDKSQLDFVKTNFKSCQKSKPNLYYAFIEKFLTSSNRLMFIVPNSFLSNLSGQYIVELVSKYSVSEMINFQDNKQFPNADTYTCIIDLSLSMNNTNILELKVGNNDIQKEYNNCCCVNNISSISPLPFQTTLSLQSVLPDDWTLSKNQIVCSFTLANSVYDINESLFENAKSELDLAIKDGVVRKKIDGKTNNQLVIFPYCNGKIIPESKLKLDFSVIYQHLLNNKSILDKRDKGKGSNYPVWYQYGRTQGLNNPKFNHKEIVWFSNYYAPDKCEPVVIKLDENFQYVLKNGMGVIINNDKEKQFWKSFINNKAIWKHITDNSQIISGGYYHLRISKIKNIIKCFGKLK
jgi:type IIS restriction enzyme eco57I